MGNDRRRRSMSPRQRERRDERFRADIERIRAAKGLPALEPAPERDQLPVAGGHEEQEEPEPSSARPAPPTPRREPQRFFCPQCNTWKDPVEHAGSGSLLCNYCARHAKTPGRARLSINGEAL
jgi:hypothetical protein